MVKFKKGYALIVTTSENDYDNLAEDIIDGLTREQAIALKAFLIKAKDYGNSFDWSSFNVADLPLKDIDVLADYWNTSLESPDFMSDVLVDLVGVWDDGQQLRCIEGINCVYFNEDVCEVIL